MGSRGINKVILVGNLGRDPEVRYSAKGEAVANFSIATSEEWTDKQSGQKQEKTEWHNCFCWGRPAEVIGEYAKKGSSMYIEGQLETSKYRKAGEDSDRYATKIKVMKFQFLGGRGNADDSHAGGDQAGGGRAAPASGKPVPGQNYDDFDDDIPF